MKVFFDMIGCRLNQAELDLLALKRVSMGDIVVTSAEDAELIFVNTCCVTKKAAADSRKMIRKYQRDTSAKVIAMGCWPSAMLDDALEILTEDALVSNDEKFNMLDYSLLDFEELTEKPELGERQRTRAFVKIQDGCRNACAFCLTTIARGKSRSTHATELIKHIKKLESFGTKEIVLTGVQLGSWGKDFDKPKDLADLISQILNETYIPRIRLSSIEPWDVSDKLIELFRYPRLCPHLHIPIQSGSDNILKAMRRPSSASQLNDLFEMIQDKAAHIAISTDVLLGFPGEGEADFQATVDLLKHSGISDGHVFSFSPMPGTVAANLEGQVQQIVVKERNKEVRDLLNRLNTQYKSRRLKTIDDVLFESKLRVDKQYYWSGLSKDMLRVLVQDDRELKNSIHRVELESIDLKGRIRGRIVSGQLK